MHHPVAAHDTLWASPLAPYLGGGSSAEPARQRRLVASSAFSPPSSSSLRAVPAAAVSLAHALLGKIHDEADELSIACVRGQLAGWGIGLGVDDLSSDSNIGRGIDDDSEILRGIPGDRAAIARDAVVSCAPLIGLANADKAAAHFRAAAGADPAGQKVPAALGLARIYQKRGEVDQAERLFRGVVADYQRQQQQQQQQQRSPTAETARSATNNGATTNAAGDAPFAVACKALGDIEWARGGVAQAVKWYEQALIIAPDGSETALVAAAKIDAIHHHATGHHATGSATGGRTGLPQLAAAPSHDDVRRRNDMRSLHRMLETLILSEQQSNDAQLLLQEDGQRPGSGGMRQFDQRQRLYFRRNRRVLGGHSEAQSADRRLLQVVHELALLPTRDSPQSRSVVLLDIGAHHGAFAEHAACLWGTTDSDGAISILIHAFEPHPAHAKHLRSYFAASNSDRRQVHVHEVAVSDRSGEAALHHGEYAFETKRGVAAANSDRTTITADAVDPHGQHSRRDSQHATLAPGRGAVLVPSVKTVAIDDFLKEEQGNGDRSDPVLFAKIDAQGAEPQVLAGMTDMLSQGRIELVLFEHSHHWEWFDDNGNDDGDNDDDDDDDGSKDTSAKRKKTKTRNLGQVVAWLDELGYSVFLVGADDLLLVTTQGGSSTLWHDEYALHWSNWLAVRRAGHSWCHQPDDNALPTSRRDLSCVEKLVRRFNRELRPPAEAWATTAETTAAATDLDDHLLELHRRATRDPQSAEQVRRDAAANLAGPGAAALDALAAAVAAAPLRQSDSTATTRLGALLAAAGRYAEAIEVLHAAARADPSDPSPRYELGTICYYFQASTAATGVGASCRSGGGGGGGGGGDALRHFNRAQQLTLKHWEHPSGARTANSLGGSKVRPQSRSSPRAVVDWCREPDVDCDVLDVGGEQYDHFVSKRTYIAHLGRRQAIPPGAAAKIDGRSSSAAGFVISGRTGVIHDSEARRVFINSHGALSPLHLDHHSTSPRPLRPRTEKRLQHVASIVQHRGSSYYHLLCEVMPRLVLLLRHGDLPAGTTVLVPPALMATEAARSGDDGQASEDGRSFVANLLPDDLTRRLHAHQVLAYRPSEFWVQADVVVYADWQDSLAARLASGAAPAASAGGEHAGALRHFRHAHYLPARSALQSLSVPLQGTLPVVTQDVVVYVSRNDSARQERRVGNEAELVAALDAALSESGPGRQGRNGRSLPARLVVALPGKMRLRAVAELFRSAHTVAGVHGAGLANAIFCSPGTRLVELAVQSPHTNHYAHIAAALGLAYTAVLVPGSFYEDRSVQAPVRAVVEAVFGMMSKRNNQST